MVNMQMVPMKKANVSLTYQYLKEEKKKKKKKNRFGNGRTFDSVKARHYLFIR